MSFAIFGVLFNILFFVFFFTAIFRIVKIFRNKSVFTTPADLKKVIPQLQQRDLTENLADCPWHFHQKDYNLDADQYRFYRQLKDIIQTYQYQILPNVFIADVLEFPSELTGGQLAAYEQARFDFLIADYDFKPFLAITIDRSTSYNNALKQVCTSAGLDFRSFQTVNLSDQQVREQLKNTVELR